MRTFFSFHKRSRTLAFVFYCKVRLLRRACAKGQSGGEGGAILVGIEAITRLQKCRLASERDKYSKCIARYQRFPHHAPGYPGFLQYYYHRHNHRASSSLLYIHLFPNTFASGRSWSLLPSGRLYLLHTGLRFCTARPILSGDGHHALSRGRG